VTEFKTLAEFAAYAKDRAKKVEAAIEYHGKMEQATWEKVYLHPNPNEEDCRFCKAMATCPAMARKVQETIGAEFDVVIAEGDAPLANVVNYPDDALAQKMAAAGLLEDFIKAVRAETERRLLANIPVEGWGLELGREGPRKWTDAEKAEEFLRAKFRLTVEQCYDMSVISPTSAEKLLKAPKKNGKSMLLSKRQWAQLQDLIVRSPASPSVKPASVIKNPYVVGDQTPKDDFETVPDEESLS
jgi:hypothetical protein